VRVDLHFIALFARFGMPVLVFVSICGIFDLSEILRSQRRPKPLELDEYKRVSRSRNDPIARAYASGGYTLKEIGTFFDLHYSRVSRIISMAKDKT
jgi:putative transposase